ncbi:D-alanyl-D-alanine carboxypeptidase [Streptomyces montanus]|uniref:D-alanyl-D-alanine carboxypeptidase n=1 Tax=Streptomyces montanus TaxID=2580423 RepID=A0A5R9FJ68_9ACTN|nr:D-alanyl-D-alanine carboxypeptidase [Streptomyces montanus]TLS43291.1 D-alanyl-D-alanine carboxypeptidase [Streptomyces montanus]
MTIGFSSRTARCCSAACVVGALALAPSPALARTGAEAAADAEAAVAHTGVESVPQASPLPPSPSDSPPSALYRPGTHVHPRAGAPKVPRNVSARSWLVADAGTGDVLAAHNAHLKLPPASTLKTLFALTVLPVMPAAVRHTVTERELAGVGDGSSRVGVAAGNTYRASDLWRGVFLNSGNDAVHVLAAMNGGWRATAVQMQAKARALGARDTRVVSPDGYDAPGQVSSAYDLAVFGRAGLRNPDFAGYCATVEAKFPGDGRPFAIQNTNRLLTGADGVEPYPGLLGVKNGYTSHAGNTLVAAARRGGRTLVVTVMNPQSNEHFAVYEETRSLLDWGFRAAGRVDPVASLDPPRAMAQAGPTATARPATAAVGASYASWTDAGAVAGAAGLGAGAVALVLRLLRGRFTWD